MEINRYIPFALIFFFVNSLGLPFGLTYTSLLAPFFYGWILLTRKKDVILPFIAILAPFIVIQSLIGSIDDRSYLISLVNLLLVYIFCQAVYTFLINCRDVEKIFHSILMANFLLCIIAIPFYFTPYFYWFWQDQVVSEGSGELRRLKMFTYEPSYYAMLFTPFFSIFFSNTYSGKTPLVKNGCCQCCFCHTCCRFPLE